MFTSRTFGRGFTVIAALAACVVFAHPKDKENNAEVKFTSRSELVLIPTLVTGKGGVHISGLTKEDFTVFENGAEQKLATFEEVTSDTHRVSHPRNPNEFSNALAGGPSTMRITLIVLDFINTPFAGQANARTQLLKYLMQSVGQSPQEQHEPTALYTLTRSGIHTIHDFTSDPRVLLAALHKVKGDAVHLVDTPEDVEAVTGTASPDGSAGVDPGQVQSEADRFQSMMEDAELNFQSFQQRLAITYTLEGMQQVAQALAGFPGRKSLIWAGGGFPFSVSDNTMQLAPAGRDTLADVLPLYEHTWQLLNNAQIALYPLDVNGLQVSVAPTASVRNPGRNYSRNLENRQMDTQATLQTFASMTGGRAYYNSNDLVRGFREAVNDSSEYYLLGYYLDRSKTKAGWRKLSVKVKRDHVEVRARSGFFVTNATVDPENSRNNDLSTALQSPLDYTSLPLVAHWGVLEPGKEAGKKKVNYDMRVPADSSVVNEADNNHVSLEFVALPKAVDGKAVGPPMGEKLDAHVSPDKVATIRQNGIIYRGALELAPGEYTVRFVVRDSLSGRVGSVAAPLRVE